MKTPPSKQMCLSLAKAYWEAKPLTLAHRKLSWEYLFCWAFYEMYIEGWGK